MKSKIGGVGGASLSAEEFGKGGCSGSEMFFLHSLHGNSCDLQNQTLAARRKHAGSLESRM